MNALFATCVFGLVAYACGAYIAPGKEYVYQYETSVAAGSEDYVSFASVFNVTGKLRVQKVDPTLLTIKLEELQYASYNGEYAPLNKPVTASKAYQQLNPLMEPVHIKLNANNLVHSIILSGNVPEWARNIHRGIATSFQLDTERATSGQETNFEVEEKTVLGECNTVHQIIKSEGSVEVRKQRNHAKCQNNPTRVLRPGTFALPCQDKNTRDVYNSSGYGVYVVSKFNGGELALTNVRVGSGLLYSVFGSKGHIQFSWASTAAKLLEIKTSGFSKIGAPSNPQTFDNLRYVYESTIGADDSLEIPSPFFSHYAHSISDEGVLKGIADKVYEDVKKLADTFETTNVYDDIEQFHKVTPFSIIPAVSVLPYANLKALNDRFKGDNKYSTHKIFLDALVVAGTGPSALLVRDIVQSEPDARITANLIAPLPNYVRNPTEKLLDEFEGLIKPDLPKHNLRIIEFAFASLIHRTCTQYECKKGHVAKYVKYFSDKYDNGATFEDKTVAVAALTNLGLGEAKAKLISIVADRTADRSVRVFAMAGLHGATQKEAKETLLPIFYDKSNHHELRTKAAVFYVVHHYDHTNVQQMVLSLWTDRCKYVKNFMYTLLEGLAYTTSPCLATKGSYARNLLAMFPPWTLDRTLSANYIRDFNDPQFNFGHETLFNIQKDGDSVFPTTVYGSLKGHIAGYGASYLSFFVRIEGLGKALADRLMSMTTGQINFDDVKSVFSKIGVQGRTSTPLRIELALFLHNKIVAYHAADASTVTTVPQLLKKLQEMKSSYDVELSRMFLLGGVRIEQPTEFGNPISVFSSLSAMGNVQIKTNREKSGTSISQTTDWNIQGGFFGLSRVGNHFPAFGTVHAVAAARTLRSRIPRKFNLNVDYKQLSVNFGIETPTKEDPVMIQTHATAFTYVANDNKLHDNTEAHDQLRASCATCKPLATISKGEQHRGSRQIAIPEVSKFKIFEGVKRGAKYFDCEKPHSRYDTIKRLIKFINEDNMNAGKLPISRLLLALQYARDYMFLSPTTHTCGIKAYYHRDPEAKSIFEKVDANFRVKYTGDPNKKLGTKVQFKGALNFKHGGAEPQTRTVDVSGQVVLAGLDKRDVKLRFLAKDEATQKNIVLCLETSTQLKKPVDFFGYEGENEPGFERKMMLKWGPEPAGKEACPENEAYIKTTRKAHRSLEQVEESKGNGWPYKECREQKGSAHWPGSTTPPSHECMQAAIDQTNLRESNITIEYQVDVEARNRWKKPAVAIAALLVPYWDVDRSTAAAHAHASHAEHTPGAKYVKGSVEIDVSLRKVNPTLDIHWHASHGEEHFHNVDLAALPGPLKVQPVFSRFSPFFYEAFSLGFFGYCAASENSVITFDNYTYHGALSDCPTLLAGDCDDKPRFAVLTRKIGAGKIGLSVYLGEHKLELEDLNTVKVDGKPQPASDTIYTDEGEEKLFKFVKVNPTYVGIIAEKLGLYIGYTGSAATVTAGTRYRSTTCGLCGNFDSNPHNDMIGPDNVCKITGADNMIKAYTVRDGQCSGVGSACPA